MALFKIFKGSDSAKLTNPQATGYKVPVDGYAYYDTSTKLFYIDADYSSNNNGTISRQPINAYKADIATLANAAVYETGPNQNDPLHKINEYYGHELTFSNHTLSLMAGDGITTLGSTVGLVSKSSDGFAPQLPNENTIGKFLRQDGQWAAGGIPIASVDSTSTATVFTAQIPELIDSAYNDNMIFLLRNTKVASKENCTLDVNGLGAKPIYDTATSRVTTAFALNTTFLFWYDSSLNSGGGGWRLGRLTDANTTYSAMGNLVMGTSSYPTSYVANSAVYRYQLLFTIDQNTLTPLNNNNNTTGTTKTMLTNVEFDPLGPIYYYTTTTAIAANGNIPLHYLYMMGHSIDMRYTFNLSSSTLTARQPLYLKVELQNNGKVKLAQTGSILSQTLPTTNDGYLYILLGRVAEYSTSSTAGYRLVLFSHHPVYFHDGTGVKEYTRSLVPDNISAFNNDVGYITGMYIASYGSSTFAEVLAAYQANKIVYCRASSNSNPASGSQGRMAFLAYVNGGDNPTEFEFQYYRSVATHTDAQQGDQVYVYKLNSSSGWSVTTREAYTKISPSSGLSKSYSSGVLTVTHATPTGASSGTKGSLDNTNLEFIQTISTDDYGHVIGHTTRSLPIYDGSAT